MMEAAAVAIFLFFWVFIIITWSLFIVSFYLAIFGLTIGLLIVWILMLVDCIQRDFPKPDDKTVWILVVVLTGWVGALIYYFMVKRPADRLAGQR